MTEVTTPVEAESKARLWLLGATLALFSSMALSWALPDAGPLWLWVGGGLAIACLENRSRWRGYASGWKANDQARADQ